ncbi:PDZ domain-containing protein [bacterium]|nr:MAG: PDZ domain-containing protein [bacterium]
MRLKSTTLALGFILGSLSAQAQVYRTPDISPDGKTIAFSYQGDIWTISANGGTANRLTIHEAYEGYPKFSPDGKNIAFSGDRFGNDDIYVIPVEGGLPKRLTFHSSPDMVSSWKGKDIVFSTAREYRQIERPLEVYEISSKGGTESRVLDAVGFDPIYSPSGRFLAFVRGDINPVFREDYKGPSNREIWIYDTKNKTYSKLDLFNTNDVFPQWAGENTLLFMSSESGMYNLYSLALDANGKASGKPNKLTSVKGHSIRYFSASGNGKHIVFTQADGMYTMSFENGKATNPVKLNVSIRADERFDPTEQKTFRTGAGKLAVSPNGKQIAFEIRGEIFVSEADKDKSRSVNVTDSPYRDTDPAWLNDSVLVFVSDRMDSNFDLYAVQSADKNEADLFKTLKRKVVRITDTKVDESNPVISNDGKRIAVQRGRGTLTVAEISSDLKLKKEKDLIDGWATPSGVTWSPDDQWLAYSIEDLEFNEEIFIRPSDGSGKPVNVTMHPRGDYSPFWNADGSKLAFISARNNRNYDIWFVWLKKEDYERTKTDWDEFEAPKKDDKSKKKGVEPVTIDFDGIHERLVQVTSASGDESNPIISPDGETIYFTAESTESGGNDIYSVKWDGKKLKEVTKGGQNPGGLQLDKDGKTIWFTKRGGSINKLDIKSDKTESISYVAKMTVDFKAERTQIFDEAWRTIRDGFYDPNYHGYDWDALGKKYRELAINASTNVDFAEIFNLMLGELNASHMRFTSPERAETQREQTGLLGVELDPEKDGMKVVRVIPNTPADKSVSKLEMGDVITALDGQKVSTGSNFYAMLSGKVDEKIVLSVRGKDKKEREVVIRPTGSVRQDMYQEWVNDRKALVEKYSKGRLGYIHIQGMNMPSFEVFERELTAAGYGKEGIVIDVRYNGGGFTTDYLMTVLNYKQHAYTIPRGAAKDLEKEKLKFRDYYPTGERLVFAAWTRPSIALCNEGSYSNAEIFSHAYKTLGIGTLVGQPTNGSVISTGGKGLIDGSFVRLPFRGWYTKATDQNQELGPAVPDILVENEPNWISTGNDAQLKRSVDELLKQIDEKK